MSILSTVKDAFVRHYKCIGAAFTLVLGILFAMDNTRAFAVSLMGIQHAIHHPDSKGYFNDSTRESHEMYTAGWRDLITVLALNLPIWVVSTFIWDFMSKYPSGAARNRFCLYLSSGLILASFLILDVFCILKVIVTEPCLLYDLKEGYMTYLVKLCFLVQSALLCYFLETLIYHRHNAPALTDKWFDGSLNMAFCIFCYCSKRFPILLWLYMPRIFLQSTLSIVQALLLLELSTKRLNQTRLVLRGLKFFTGIECVWYIFFIALNSMSSFVMFGFLASMLVVSGSRLLSSKNFDLNLMGASIDTQDVNFAAAVSGNQPALLIVPAPGQLLALPPGPTIENTK